MLLGTALATAGGAAAVGFAGARLSGSTPGDAPTPRSDDIVSPFGAHQAGIETAQQKHAMLVAVDLSTPDAGALGEFLKDVSETIVRIGRGDEPPPSPVFPAGAAAPTDFATGLSPARLTITVGIGPRVLGLPGIRRPSPRRLRALPSFNGDGLDARCCDGDLVFQICAEDAQIVSAAMRALRARMPGHASLRWTQSGFLSVPMSGGTPRNVFGHKDGTSNPRTASAAFAQTVWAKDDEPDWFAGGTYLVFRKIRMKTAEWDLTARRDQDETIGRRRSDGAPLTGSDEFDEPDLDAESDGRPVIGSDAHIRRVRGFSMFRRSYNYDYGQLISTAGGNPDPTVSADHEHAPDAPEHTHGGHGAIDVGLLFCAYGNDPDRQFIPAQRASAESDRLNTFVTHTGSALFAILPGFRHDGHLGDTFL